MTLPLRKKFRPNPVRRLLREAIVDLNEQGIQQSAGLVTGWNNSGTGGSDYDLTTVLGTAANLQFHEAGATVGGQVNNTGKAAVASLGGSGLETASSQIISYPLTYFVIAKAHALTGAFQTIVGARSDYANDPVTYIDTNDNFRANAGAGASVTPGDTNLRLHILRHNGDATSKYAVVGVGENQTNLGTENFDALTLFASPVGTATLTGFISTLIVFDRALTDTEVNLITNHLTTSYGVAA